MNWKDVGKKLAKHGLQLLGSAVPGGGFITGVVADILGVDDNPAAVNAALDGAGGEVFAELTKYQLAQKTELQRIATENQTARIKAVNETMRVESKSEKWWQSGWRPFWGFVSGAAFFFVCILVCALAYKAVLQADSNAMMMIPQFITSITALFAVPGAILGISAWHRGKEKIEKARVGL